MGKSKKSILRFKQNELSKKSQQSINGGSKNQFKNLLSTHINLAQAKQSGNFQQIAIYQDDLDCLSFASTNSCCGNGLGLW